MTMGLMTKKLWGGCRKQAISISKVKLHACSTAKLLDLVTADLMP